MKARDVSVGDVLHWLEEDVTALDVFIEDDGTITLELEGESGHSALFSYQRDEEVAVKERDK